MSEQTPEAFVVPADPTGAFSALLGFLAPEADAAPDAAGAAPDAGAAAGAGQQPAAAEGAGAAGAAASAPAAGDGGQPVVPVAGDTAAGAADAGAGAAEPPPGTSDVDVAVVTEKLSEISTAFETHQSELLKQTALTDVKKEYPKYFEAISKHPRFLVGQVVPSITGVGMETIRDTQDAKDWQEATKQLLVDEVNSRAGKAGDELATVFATVHSSIELFRNNTDLVPGTKQFDAALANAFATSAKDYEVRTNGKLIGYSVPVQPIINAVRAQLAAQKAAAPPVTVVPAVPVVQQQRAADGRWEGPQGGLTSKAGQSAAAGSDDAGGVMAAFYRQNGLKI